MKILTTSLPTSHQIAQADKLCAVCCQFDHISLEFPKQAAWYGFCVSGCRVPCDNDEFVSAMALFEEEDGLFSLSAFTLPSMRRQGLFSALLEKAVSWLETRHPQADIDIIADLSCPAAAHTLAALGAEAWYEDFQMCRAIPEKISDFCTSEFHSSAFPASDFFASHPDVSGSPASHFPVSMQICLETPADVSDSVSVVKPSRSLTDAALFDCFYLTLCAASDTSNLPDGYHTADVPADVSPPSPAVWAHLTVTSPGTAWLHDVETAKALRRQGLATCFLHTLFSRLADSPIRTLFLHVTSDNLPAVALYRKTGFHTVQTLSHFLY